MTAGWIAGLDPGRSKCGLVLADLAQARVLEAAILPPEASRTQLQTWQRQGLTRVVVGNGTSSDTWRRPLAALALELELVDEHGSTLAARDRYWELYPASGWLRLLPAGLRLQLVIHLEQIAQQGILDQGPAQRRLHTELTTIEGPTKTPLITTGAHLTFQHPLAEALMQHPQLGRGGGKSGHGVRLLRLPAGNC